MRKLALPLAATAAMLAMTASMASAQNVQVTSEVTGAPCPSVLPGDSSEFPVDSTISGGCVAHIVSTEGLVLLTAHFFGVETTDFACSHEYTSRIGGDGEGYLTDVELAGASCPRRPCGTAAGALEGWEIHIEETTSTTTRAEMHVCIESPDGGVRQTCHMFVPLREDPVGSHRYEMGTASASETRTDSSCDGPSGFRPEFSGHWKTELSTFELVHTL